MICCRRGGIVAAFDLVPVFGMAPGTGKVQALCVHMDIKGMVGIDKGGVKITMLNPVTSATFEVAGAAGCSGTWADIAGNFFQINRRKNLFAEFFFSVRWITTACREFFICPGCIVTYQAIYILLRGKIK